MEYCPTRDEVTAMMLSLLPRGKAWQSEDGAIAIADSKLKSFWYAVAGPWADLETTICNQYEELFAATASESIDLWFEDYGLPDEADPFGNDLAARVAFTGGTSEAYYENLALALGWVATMHWIKGASTLEVTIDLDASPAAADVTDFSNWEIGISPLGDAQPSNLIILLDRIVPAHCVISWSSGIDVGGDDAEAFVSLWG